MLDIEERHYTRPGESLRLAYTEAEIRTSVLANIELLTAYCKKHENLAKEAAKRSGVEDISIEKMIALIERRDMQIDDRLLSFDAETALRHASYVRMGRARLDFLTMIRDHGVFVVKTDDGRALLPLQEAMVLVRPMTPERDFDRYSPAPMLGRPRQMGLGTVMQNDARAFGAQQAEMSLSDILADK